MAPGPSILNPFRGYNSEDNDPKYKNLAASIERALGTWDNVQEWADYISFIGKLQKAFRNYNGTKNIAIPNAHLVSRRLAQCIDPDLPYGVHQKALELYKTIFELQGPDNLSPRVWLPGLLPLMTFASMNVKPLLIALIQKYVLPLSSLRSVLQALLLSLLPGIDDESSESFNDVFVLIENIQLKINDDAYFWQCFFTVVVKSSDRRLGALAWLSRKLPQFSIVQSYAVSDIHTRDDAYKALSYEAQMAITPEPGMLVRAFCSGLNDEQQLVQRGFLDLLVKNLELQSPVLRIVVQKADLKMLILSACGTVLRKDMSLNRRLWNWLLGPEPDLSQTAATSTNDATVSNSTTSRAEYFKKHGLEALSEGLLERIRSDTSNASEKSRTYKVCHSILDRWEISSAVIPRVLLPIVQSVRDFEAQNDNDFDEVLRSASIFFDAVEPQAIWSDCFSLITQPSPNFSLLLYIIQNFNVKDEEMVLNHLPLMLLTMMIIKSKKPEQQSHEDTENWHLICNNILELIPKRAFSTPDPSIIDGESPEPTEILATIKDAYSLALDDDMTLPFDQVTLTNYIVREALQVALKLEPDSGRYLDLVASLITKLPESTTISRSNNLVKLIQCIKSTDNPGYPLISGSISLFNATSSLLTALERDELIKVYCGMLFKFLAEVSGSYQLEAVSLLWSLQAATDDDREVQSALANIMVDPLICDADKEQFFSVLWYHSISNPASDLMLDQCLFLYMDLNNKDWVSSVSAKTSKLPSWLKYDVEKLLNMLCAPLLQAPDAYGVDDLELNVYHVRILSKVIENDSQIKARYKFRAKQLVDTLINRFFHQPVEKITELPEELLKFISLSVPLLSQEHVTQLHETFLQIQRTEILDVFRQCLDHSKILEHGKLLTYISRGIMMACERSSFPYTTRSRPVSKWVQFLVDCMKHFHPVFLEVIGPICQCLCSCISSLFEDVKKSFSGRLDNDVYLDMSGVPHLLSGLEEIMIISNSYKEKKVHDTSKKSSISSYTNGGASTPSGGGTVAAPDSPNSSVLQLPSENGFLNNVISGVFSVESPLERNANNMERQDILRCFEMSIKTAFAVWQRSTVRSASASSSSSSLDTSTLDRKFDRQNDSMSFILAKGKSRARKLLTQLYRLDPLQTLECLIRIYMDEGTADIIKLIHVIDGSRPKLTIPHLLDSVTMRVSESLVAGSQNADVPFKDVSTVLSITEISQHSALKFVNVYASSLEKDAIEDIWSNCIGFIKEVQSSQTHYKQLLPVVLELLSIMAAKVNSIKFGEQKRVRKELTDNFTRLLNYSLSRIGGAASSSTFQQSNTSLAVPDADDEKQPAVGSPLISGEKSFRSDSHLVATSTGSAAATTTSVYNPRHEELVKVLKDYVLPNLAALSNDDYDRIQTTIGSITQGIIAPAVKGKKFPRDTPVYIVDLLVAICSKFPQSKLWKPTVAEAIFDNDLLTVNFIVLEKWMQVISRWIAVSTDQIREFLAKLSTYGGNSTVLFNWSDQERVTQTNIDRLSLFFLSNKYLTQTAVATWTDMIDFKELSNKFEVLISSKSQDNRLRFGPHIFNCLRAIFVSVPETKLSPLVSLTYSQLQEVFLVFLEDPKAYTDIKTLAAACKLLDVLIAVNLESFQMQEWLFICDSMDAVFKDDNHLNDGLIDTIAAELKVSIPTRQHNQDIGEIPILLGTRLTSIAKSEDLHWFFQRLTLSNYESTYSMSRADLDVCSTDLLLDLSDSAADK